MKPSTLGLEGKDCSNNRGMGKAAATTFTREGATLVLTVRRANEGEAVAAGLREEGAEATFMQADVKKEEDIRNLVDVAVKKYGRIDVVFNNAGTDGQFTPFTDTNVKGKIRHTVKAIRFEDINENINLLRDGEIVGRAVIKY
jgi:NAD(P)-dependent dehydrogenase (short-subunit alcohol dehydrogenase family)